MSSFYLGWQGYVDILVSPDAGALQGYGHLGRGHRARVIRVRHLVPVLAEKKHVRKLQYISVDHKD